MKFRIFLAALAISCISFSHLSAQGGPGDPGGGASMNLVCPLNLYGQWNGVYYYEGEFLNANGDCEAVDATSNRMHQLGNDCNDIIDPLVVIPTIRAMPVVTKATKKRRTLDHASRAEVKRYVGVAKFETEKGGETILGRGVDIRSTFCRSSQQIKIKDDFVVFIVIPATLQHTEETRHFRVVGIEAPGSWKSAQKKTRYFGQQLDPSGPLPTIAVEAHVMNLNLFDQRVAHLKAKVKNKEIEILSVSLHEIQTGVF